MQSGALNELVIELQIKGKTSFQIGKPIEKQA